MTYRILLDTSSLMYRAFFSIPPSVTNAEGQPVNALHGYLDMTSRLISNYHPDETVHVYDADWKPAPRVAAFAGYKSKRLPDPAGLPEQFVMLREVLDALGLAQAEAPGWEAEDAIGALAAPVRGRDRVDVVTGDRDLIQLVRDPHVRVLFTLRGVTEVRVLDEAGVLEKYGVPAARYAEFAILRGDPSDALPGVPGVGEKTARALVVAYPSLDAMMEDAKWAKESDRPLQRSASLRAKVRDAAEYLHAMREVVPIKTDVDVSSWRAERDDARLGELAERYRLGGPVRRLNEALAARPAAGRR
jgi:5'-3' exonuclease